MSPTPTANAPTTLSPEILAFLRREAVEIAGAEGDVLVRRGDPGVGFWAVLDGTVEVRLVGTDGVHLPLARMGPGSTFGEMALVTGEPVSADVVALTGVRLLRYPAERFEAALGECAPLRALVMARMAAHLRGTSTEVWNFYQQARALNVVMGPHRETGALVAESAAMRPLRELLARRAQDDAPVLISGAPGSGKFYAAAKIHEGGGRPDAPFIVVDCRTLDAAEAMRFLLGSEDGFSPDGAHDTARSLRRYGALQLAHGGTLVLRHADELPAPVQAAFGRYGLARRDGAVDYPLTRLVMTTDLAAAEFRSAVDAALAESVADPVVNVPRLHERRKDIVALAHLFLAERSPQSPRSLSRGAEHALLSQRYDHRNAAELRDAVNLASMVADEPEIQAEHVFSGPRGNGLVKEIDLSSFALTRTLTSPQVIGAMRAFVFVMFSTILVTSLVWSDYPTGAVANSMIWAVWEPALFLAFLLLGRVWCTFCALSTAGRLAARLGSLNLIPGPFLKKYSAWLIAAGFLAVIWVEHMFGMTGHPRAAAGLLLGLFCCAVISSLIWRRETWCRYLCPLGNLGAALSLPATLTVRSNQSVCSTVCQTHECFKGSAQQPGCPVFHHPLNTSELNFCKLCLQCLRVCPNGSTRLVLRMPLQSIWAQAEVGEALAPFALFLFFFAPVMLASDGSSWVATAVGFNLASCLSLLATAVVAARLSGWLAAGPDPAPSLASRVAFALLVLAWGPGMAFQLGHIGALESLRLSAAPGSVIAALLPADGVSLMTIAQLLVIAVGGACCAVCFTGIHARLRRDQEPYSRAGWWGVTTTCAAYLAGMFALVVVG